MKRVYSSFNLQLVHHKKNLLQAEGIAAVVKNEILSSAMGELPPAECQAELWIEDERDLTRALEIIQAKIKAGPSWNCPNCSETSEGQFSHCWNCGAASPSPRPG